MDESDSMPITDPATEPVNPESPSGLRLAKFLCSFGGSILPRPLDGRLRYVGGETRIITVPHDVSFSNLLLKMQEAFDGVDLIKYQQPDEDLDALVSVVNDDDLVNMMDEYDKLISCGEAFTRLRIFLFSLNQLDCETESPIYYEASERDGERRYVDALNCLIDPKTGLNSSDTEAGLTGNVSLRHLNVPRSWSAGYLSPKPFRDHSGPTSPSTVKFQVGSEEPNDPWIPDKSGFPCSLGKYVDGNGSFCENCHTPYRQYADPPHRYYTGQTGHFHCGINNNPCNENEASYHYYHNDPHGNDNRMWVPPPSPNYHRVPVPDPYMVPDGNRINYPYQHGNMYEDNNARYFNNHHVVGNEINTNEMFHTNNSQQRYGEMESLFQVPQNVPPIPSLRRKIQPATLPINGVINPQFGVINPQIIRGTQDGTPNGGGMINPQFGSPNGGTINTQFGTPNGGMINPQFGTLNGGSINPQFGNPNGGMINPQFGTPNGGTINPQFGNPNGGTINPQFGTPNGGTVNPQFGTLNGVSINPQFGTANGGMINPQFITLNGGSINPQLGTLNGGTINPQSGTLNGGTINPQFGTLNGGSMNPQFGTLNGGTINPQSGTLNGGMINPQFGTANGGMINPPFVRGTPDGTRNGGMRVNPIFVGGIKGGFGIGTPEASPRPPLQEYNGSRLNPNGNGNGLLQCQPGTETPVPETPSPDSANPVTPLPAKSVKEPEKENEAESLVVPNGNEERQTGEESNVCLSEVVESAKNISLQGDVAKEEQTNVDESEKTKADETDSSHEVSPVVEDHDKQSGDADHEAETEGHDEQEKDTSKIESSSAEQEARDKGLQTIKNEDLEEVRELGHGTYGSVFHGKWRGSDVAIKKIKASCFAGRPSEREKLIADFWKEAYILSLLHHPNVVSFYGVVRDGPDGSLATVTEFMVNGSLKQFLHKKDRTIDRRKRLIIAMDAAFGMEYLHGKNIVHFDLKCENLLVNMRDPQRPVCKIGDLGLSKIKQHTLVSGGVRGTLPWMAPELLSGKSNMVSEKIDVYSFGICMWELLTGEEPYAEMPTASIIGDLINNTLRPVIPTWCDPEWKSLMQSCWESDPTQRPSFSDISQKLRKMASAVNVK